jgi:hypothetical protein
VITSSSLGDLDSNNENKVVTMALELPKHVKMTGVPICYENSNPVVCSRGADHVATIEDHLCRNWRAHPCPGPFRCYPTDRVALASDVTQNIVLGAPPSTMFMLLSKRAQAPRCSPLSHQKWAQSG